ncbi:alpha/beta fold hydrolase [Nocardioides sp. LS1]|uniref:alpha/beta fold hydrolase n=1 Tax=Nocardioides sp. LS1 TaxID=1027620 RepID=UPI000F61A415|nr:alpha/beta hydrolase [Nocardioides sp. LS1]GCD88490.1 alpha/beta hydrolase [Nocardioides sp. LS1]
MTLLRLADGRDVQLWEGGDPAGTPVAFLHGCPDTRHAARPGHDAARRAGVRLVAVNRPGYGRSTATATSHAAVADDVAEVADLLGIGRFAVLGMSVGGPHALACAARHPDRVTRVAVVSSPALDPTPPEDAGVGTVADFVERLRPEFAAYVARLAPDDPDDRALAGRFLAQLPEEDRVLLGDDVAAVAAVAASVREALAQHEGYLWDAATLLRPWDFDLADVACPVTLHYGGLDTNHPPRNGAWLAERLADATLTVDEGDGHLGALLAHWDDLLGELAQDRVEHD